MSALSRVVALMVVVAVGPVVVLALAGEEDPRLEANETAPVSPPRIPARPATAVSDEPGEGDEVEEARLVELGLPSPSEFGPTTPQHAVARFHDAWHDRAWDRMALWTSRAWRAGQADAGAELRERFGAYRLRGWTIEDVSRNGAAAVVTVIQARRDLEPQIERERLRFALVRAERGRWGIVLAPRGS